MQDEEDIRFPVAPCPPPGQTRFSWSLGRDWGCDNFCPPGTDDFCFMSLSVLSRVENVSCFSPAIASYSFVSERVEGSAVLCLSLIAVDHHLVLMQGPERGWYTCSSLKTLQVLHELAPPGGLFQVSCPLPIFLVSKELFRESRFSLGRAGSSQEH